MGGTGELTRKNKKSMWPFKKREEPDLSQKIEKAILKKKRQMVAMYLIGIMGGSAWCYTYFEGAKVFAALTTSEKVMVFENTRVISTVKAAEPEVKWETAEFSAYTPRPEETDGNPYITASGERVSSAGIACPKAMKFGTRIEVKGMGVYVCNDVMAQRYRDKANFDIFFWDLQEAKAFGRKTLEWREA